MVWSFISITFHIHLYIKEAEEEDIRRIGQMFSCWVSHNPLFSQWCLSYTENFLFDDESLSNFTEEKPSIQKGKGRTRTRKPKSKNREHSIMVMHNKCCKRKHHGLAKGGKTYVLNFSLVA